MKYVPTPGPLPGEQFIPSNSDDGSIFLDGFCANCDRDKELNGTKNYLDPDDAEGDHCPIVAASYRGEAVEWRKIDGELKCIKFWPLGVPEPDPNTLDMFEELKP